MLSHLTEPGEESKQLKVCFARSFDKLTLTAPIEESSFRLEPAGSSPVAQCPPASGREKSIKTDFSATLHSARNDDPVKEYIICLKEYNYHL